MIMLIYDKNILIIIALVSRKINFKYIIKLNNIVFDYIIQIMSLFIPDDRNYLKWTLQPNIELKDFDPIQKKMLVNDEITIDNVNYKSNYRSMQSIPGVLVFNGNTYGRKNKRVLYKCIPNDNKLPIFLVPYTQKESKFNKTKVNKYVLFKFDNWDEKHPYGIITNTLGDVNDMNIFYDYQLYCKNLHYSIQKLNKNVKMKLNKLNNEAGIYKKVNDNYNIENREKFDVFTIDPKETTDYDDAFGVRKINEYETIISIYISNVPLILSILELWDNLSQRVSTIYLPNKKVPMIPNILSDNICSLIENKKRFVLALDIHITNESILTILNYKVCSIIVKKNYVYEDDKLLRKQDYKKILDISKKLNLERKYKEEIYDSHDVVEFYMILMNHETGIILNNNKMGIFRNVIRDNINTLKNDELLKVLDVISNVKGNYELYDKQVGHQLIGEGLTAYSQITSPIRRIVDVINMIYLQTCLNMITFDNNVFDFIQIWIEKLNLINNDMKKIRKIQNDCSLISKCIFENENAVNNIYHGYIIEINMKNMKYKNKVYIPALKLMSYVECNNKKELYSSSKFTLHMFTQEHTLKRKIRLQYL